MFFVKAVKEMAVALWERRPLPYKKCVYRQPEFQSSIQNLCRRISMKRKWGMREDWSYLRSE